jgi:hypothetical protein
VLFFAEYILICILVSQKNTIMITKSYITRYLLSDLINFIKNILTICTGSTIAKQEVKNFMDVLQEKYGQIDAAYAYQKESPESQEIEAEEAKRDTAWIGIKTVVKGYTLHFDDTIKKAANLILACMEKYGKDVQRQSDTTETTIIEKFVAELENDTALAAAIATLNLGSWVAELKNANIAFNTKFLERNKKYSLKPKESATELKPTLIAAYETLALQIGSRNNIDTTGKYTTLVNELNTLVGKYNAKVVARDASGGTSKSNNKPTT